MQLTGLASGFSRSQASLSSFGGYFSNIRLPDLPYLSSAPVQKISDQHGQKFVESGIPDQSRTLSSLNSHPFHHIVMQTCLSMQIRTNFMEVVSAAVFVTGEFASEVKKTNLKQLYDKSWCYSYEAQGTSSNFDQVMFNQRASLLNMLNVIRF